MYSGQVDSTSQNGHAFTNADAQKRQKVAGEDAIPTNSSPRLPPSTRSKDARGRERSSSWFGFGKKSSKASLSTNESQETAANDANGALVPAIAPYVTADPMEDIVAEEQVADSSDTTPMLIPATAEPVASASRPTPQIPPSTELPLAREESEVKAVAEDVQQSAGTSGDERSEVNPTSQSNHLIISGDAQIPQKTTGASDVRAETTSLSAQLSASEVGKTTGARSASWFSFGNKVPAPKSPLVTKDERRIAVTLPPPVQAPVAHSAAVSVPAEQVVSEGMATDLASPTPVVAQAIDLPAKPRSTELESATASPRARGWFGSNSKGKGQTPAFRENEAIPVPPTPQSSSDAQSVTETQTVTPSSHQPPEKSVWFSPQSPPRPAPVEQPSSTPSSIDSEVPPHPDPSPINIPPPELISTQTIDAKLSALNPAASRFALSLPLLGRPKAPLEKAAKPVHSEAPQEPLKEMEPTSEQYSRQSDVFKVF